MRRTPGVSLFHPPPRKPTLAQRYGGLAALGLAFGATVGIGLSVLPGGRIAQLNSSNDVGCTNPKIVDGDTIKCGAQRIRLTGIDAPELPGHCQQWKTCAQGDPYASTESLRRLIGGGRVICRQTDTDRYGRVVARCSAVGRDLSCAQVRGGYAIKRYAPLTC